MARIIIDAGHGGSERAGNSSACGARGATGVVEKDVTLDIAKHVISRLGGAAALTRTGDRNMTLGARAAKAQQADVFVSIHANYGAPELSGSEVYVHPDAGRGSRALAGQIARALDRLAARYSGGAEKRRGAMAVLNPTAIGQTAACLIEVDYLSNPRGERRLGDPGERAAIGAAIAGAIQQHLAEGQQVDLAGAIARILPAIQSSSMPERQKNRLRDLFTILRDNPSADDRYINGFNSLLPTIGPRLNDQQFGAMMNRVTSDLQTEVGWDRAGDNMPLALLDDRIMRGIDYLNRRGATDGAAMAAGLLQLKDWAADRQHDRNSVYYAYGDMQERYEGRYGQLSLRRSALDSGRYGYVREGRRTIRGHAREQIEFLVSPEDQHNAIHLGGDARLIDGAERRLVARLVDMVAPDQGLGLAQHLELVSGSAVRLPFCWPARGLGHYAVQLWVESSSPSTRVDLDYTLSLHNYGGGSSFGRHAHALDRASPDPFIIPSPSDYVGAGLFNYVAVWGSWFADYAAWRAGVPMAAYSTFPHNAIAELEITRTDGVTEVATGFYVGPNKLLTNGHVFMHGPNRAASIRVRLAKPPGIMWTTGGTTFTITNPASHCHPRWATGNEDGFDLGVLRTPGVSPTQFFPLPSVCPADNQNMVVCGYAKFTADPVPVMQQGQYMDGGQIAGADGEMYFFPNQSLPGGSGSPVFWPSRHGMVIAVFSGPRVVLTPAGPDMHPSENRGVMLTPAKNTWIESV
jgi:V8-like Glu-specific endopeptidase